MEDKMIYKDVSQPVEARVEDLLSRMTLEEKAAQLCGNLPGSVITEGKVNVEKLRELFPNGHGRFTQYSMVGISSPEVIANATNEIQRYFVEETRLGIPVALQSENLCGYPGAEGTLFPSMLNMASTWEPDLAKEMAGIIGQESRAVGINSAMSPVIDVSRDPRWGRTYETFGEDPYLTSQMGVNYIQGMQGDKKDGVACIAKHFLGYAETQAGLNCAAARINDRELYEVFATPFEAAAKEADVSGMMANYGEIDGLNVCANPKIAKELLRDTMGFRGMLTSDGGGIMRLWSFYKLTRTYSEAGLLAKKCGVDTEIPVGLGFAALPEYVRQGMIDEEVLDESVRRILTIKFEYGLFDNPYTDVEAVKNALENSQKKALGKKIAKDSLILLKNDGTLPLKKGVKLAVIGPHADSLRYPVSGYTYPAYIEMVEGFTQDKDVSFGGIGDEVAMEKNKADDKEKAPNPFSAMFSCLSEEQLASVGSMKDILRKMEAVSLKEELEKRFDVAYAEGCTITGTEKDGFADAVKAAEESDVVVMALGGNCGWVDVTGGEGKDRTSLELPGVQQQLLEAVAETGKPVVVVLYGPGCFSVNWAAENASAIVQAWMPGPAAGEVVADVLDGTANPGGKLTVTIPRSVGQVPIYYNHKVGSGYTDGADATSPAIFSGGYVNEEATPLYPFGHGLSYTSFECTDAQIHEKETPTNGSVTVSCTVKNVGERTGSEVVQLYTHFIDAHVIRPNKSLCGFKRVELAPGESKSVEIELDMALLGYYNEEMKFVVEPGELEIMLGTSAHDLFFKDSVQLTGETVEVLGRRKYSSKVIVK